MEIVKKPPPTPPDQSSKRVDWAAVHSRLKANQEAIDQIFDTGSSKAKLIFAERAERMAARLKATRDQDNITVMSFEITRERYCLEVSDLAEILPFTGCTPVPGCPPEIKGVISVRGEFRCVIDLSTLLGLATQDNADTGGYILLLRHDGFAAGLFVNQVHQVEILDRSLFMNQEAGGAGTIGQFVKGVHPNSLIYLNLPHVLSHPIFQGIA